MSESTPRYDATTVRDCYDREGYYVFRQVMSQAAIRQLHDHLEHQVYPDATPLLRHPSITPEPHAYQMERDGTRFVSNSLYNPHLEEATAPLGKLLVDLICTDAVAGILQALDDEPQHTLHQIILFFVQANTAPHIDGWAIDTDPPGNFVTLWIPLQEITLNNGPVGIFPWRRGNFLTPEALGIDGIKDIPPAEAYGVYHDALWNVIEQQQPKIVVPLLKPGDLIVFSATTPHATMPPRSEAMVRRALQIMVRPSSSRWGGNMLSRLQGGVGPGDDPSDVPVNDRWLLSMSQRRKDR